MKTLLMLLAVVALASGCSKSEKKKTEVKASATPVLTPGSETREMPRLPDTAGADPSAGASADDEVKDRAADGQDRPLRQTMGERLARYDTDGDGKISHEERDAMRKARVEKTFSEVDGNGDGKISKDEITQKRNHVTMRLLRRFDRLDQDHDGALDSDEVQASMRRRHGRFGWGGRRHRHRGGAQPAPEGGGTSGN